MNTVERAVCKLAGSLRQPSLWLATLLAAVMCGCGAGSVTSPTPTAVLSQATPTATPTATPAARLPADPCQWLLASDAPPLLGHAVDTSVDGIATEAGLANGLLECSYSTGTLEERVPPPPAMETDARVTILNSTAFSQAKDPTQPGVVTYTISPVPASTIIPGASTSDTTFYAISVGPAAQGHFTWTYLYVQVDGDVYFRVGVADPSSSIAQREAKDVTAALDVLRNLKLSP